MQNSGLPSVLIQSLIFISLICKVRSVSQDFFKFSSFIESPIEETVVWNATAFIPQGRKEILSAVCGIARQGKFHAIIGPSGSGKTTLLSVLANNVPKKSLILDGKVLSVPQLESIFVQQDDLLFGQLSVIETLDTSAALRLNDEESTRCSLVDNLVLKLGLKKVRDVRVGDSKTRGVSGGEKKRLCIGNECIGSSVGLNSSTSHVSTVIYADEPTSGLDSYQAQRVVELLKGLADNGCTVVCSIHQPRASVYKMFDDITLLAEGRCMYSGSKAGMISHFKSCGYPCPFHINPAEHYVDLVSVDYSSPELERSSKDRILRLANIFSDKQTKGIARSLSSARFKSIYAKGKLFPARKAFHGRHLMTELRGMKEKFSKFFPRLKLVKKFTILLRRAWRQITRDKALNTARLCSSLFSALLFGAIYFRMGTGASTVPDRLGNSQKSVSSSYYWPLIVYNPSTHMNSSHNNINMKLNDLELCDIMSYIIPPKTSHSCTPFLTLLGLLQVAAVNTAMTALIKATTSFVSEKQIVQRERKSGAYTVFPYFLSKLLAEAPLSAFYPSFAGSH